MAEKRLILHVGAPKCGSTALQTAFSHGLEFGHPFGEKFRYAVLDGKGGVVLGQDVKRRAVRSVSGVALSAHLKLLTEVSPLVRTATCAALNMALSKSSIILSQEGWMRRPQEFAALNILSRVNAPVDVVAYVRPHPDFLNASWWQWGGKYLKSLKPLEPAPWGELMETWRSMPGVRAVYPRILNNDIVSDFFNLMGCQGPENKVANRSLPATALRFMQRRRDLQGSDMHFILGNALKDLNEGTPWILPHDYVAQVVESMQADNQRLRALLDPESQARMDADPRWWDAAAYADKKVESMSPAPPDGAGAEELAATLAKRLMLVERELAALKARTFR